MAGILGGNMRALHVARQGWGSDALSATPTPLGEYGSKYQGTGLEALPEDFLKYRDEVRDAVLSIATPLNISIFVIFLTLIYFRFRPTEPLVINSEKPIVFRTFTPRTLLHFNGTKSEPHNPEGSVYLAVKGKVYDVSAGRNFYGPGGPYENFAGRDATRGLACQSFEEDMLTKNLDGPLDDCSDLTEEQLSNLQGWVERFDDKYLIVGNLKSFAKISKDSTFQQ